MANGEDADVPPASPDRAIQEFLDSNWYAAYNATQEALEALRRVHPMMVAHLPETATDFMKGALASVEAAHVHLHRAGKYVIGQAAYDDLLEEQTRRTINKEPS